MMIVSGKDNLLCSNDVSSEPKDSEYRVGGVSATLRDAAGLRYRVISDGAEVVVEYTDGRVFRQSGAGDVAYGPAASRYSFSKGSRTITSYPITVRPTKGPASVVVNKFDTSVAGGVLANFTASASEGDKLVFTVEGLQQSATYLVKKGGVDLTSVKADKDGRIEFDNSVWPAGAFTIEKKPGE